MRVGKWCGKLFLQRLRRKKKEQDLKRLKKEGKDGDSNGEAQSWGSDNETGAAR